MQIDNRFVEAWNFPASQRLQARGVRWPVKQAFNIKVTTVGDELLYANGKSKVVAISGKDRSSIGLAGQLGTAYMHSKATGRFITSDYYMTEYPAWWKSFYANKPPE